MNSVIIEDILKNMYNIISNKYKSSTKGYSFKGGYILKSLLDTDDIVGGIRRTTDIDMTVVNKDTFLDIVNCVTPYLKDLQSKGIIYNYKVTEPKVGEKNLSGRIKLYIKPGDNLPKRVLCGMDISIHPMDYGIVELKGVYVYSLERMLADKVSVMYSSKEKIFKRIRDVLDIYLILTYARKIENLNIDRLVYCINRRSEESNINFNRRSVLENIASHNYNELFNVFKNLLNSEKVSRKFIDEENIDAIIKGVINFINYVMMRRRG